MSAIPILIDVAVGAIGSESLAPELVPVTDRLRVVAAVEQAGVAR
ncbi:hypothetical protein [Nocardia miyunensis]|nr:hypothetical protein [Nocardia miyunensis]